jgi:UDP-N-acetylmuramoylalanine--D-glutamate ligase
MFEEWAGRDQEVAVVGLGRSGVSVSRLLRREGVLVYASDAGQPADGTAAADLESLGVSVEIGAHDLERIAKAAALIVSPGVPPASGPLMAAKNAGTPVFAEIDVAIRALPEETRLIGITGTNGKTTTTALTAHLLRGAGLDAVAAGNIGEPLSQVAMRDEVPGWIAVELSSFQLHDAPNLRLVVGMLLNLAPDHLDRYDSLEEYYADKARLFRNAVPDSVWVTNRDDPEVQRLATDVPGTHLGFSLEERATGWYDEATGQLMVGDVPVIDREAFQLLGSHNVANALAATLGTHAVGVPLEVIGEHLGEFAPLPHRLEPVRVVDEVLWINDSKATNVMSTAMATASIDGSFVLLLGGRHKGTPYSRLVPTLERCRAVVAYGESSEEIERDLGAAAKVHTVGTSFEDVIARAREVAQPGDAVLLSPACSSFDMFDNYEQRGRAFREAVERL